ncbi:MAG: T9SS type A sorting domain-containing protein [Lewinellaceae bacterium]|nr:T9SS type A sorting domain-containing protein [Lewinellaceae bacterium]
MKNFNTLFCLMLFFTLRLAAQPAGMLDSTFNQTGIIATNLNGHPTRFDRVRVQPDGKIVAFGYTELSSSLHHMAVARFLEDGTPDPGFGTSGIVEITNCNCAASDGHLLPDGKMLLTGENIDAVRMMLLRLTPDGSPDTTFGPYGMQTVDAGFYISGINRSFIQTDGKIILTGNHYDFSEPDYNRGFCMRVLANGSIDLSYGQNGVISHSAQIPGFGPVVYEGGVLLSDGKMIRLGRVGATQALSKWVLARFNGQGKPDSSFGTNGVVIKDIGNTFPEAAFDAVRLDNGQMLVSGYAQKQNGFHFTVLRLNDDGSVDNSFGLGGKAQATVKCCYSSALSMILQPDRKILTVGYGGNTTSDRDLAVVRFKANGLVDQTFGTNGQVLVTLPAGDVKEFGLSLALQDDGRILAAGYAADNSSLQSALVLRLLPGTLVHTTIPAEMETLQIMPNPIAGHQCQLQYQLIAPTTLNISLFNLQGNLITTLLLQEKRPAGQQTETLELPRDLPPGIYLLRLETTQGSVTRKIILVG